VTREQFEEIAQHAFDSLPDSFKHKVENVQIVVEDYPSDDALSRTRAGKYNLLGLYQGVPLPHRGTSYGMYPVAPPVRKPNDELLKSSSMSSGIILE
jgi:predicted Zn-dependent protease with MMP-like domain